jgi:hypothetical protein
MGTDEDNVSELKPQDRSVSSSSSSKENRRGVPQRVAVQRHRHGLAGIDRVVVTADEIGGSEQAGRHARREKLAVPRPVIVVRRLAGAFAPQHAADGNARPKRES